MGIPEDSKLFISFGAIRPYKRIESAIEAFARLGSTFQYLVVGQGPDEHYVESLRRACAEVPNVHVVPERTTDEELASFMSLADAALFTYSKVLHSSAVVAARSLGLPVLTSPLGSLPEYASFDRGIHLLDSRPLRVQLEEFSNFGFHPSPSEYEWPNIATSLKAFFADST